MDEHDEFQAEHEALLASRLELAELVGKEAADEFLSSRSWICDWVNLPAYGTLDVPTQEALLQWMERRERLLESLENAQYYAWKAEY